MNQKEQVVVGLLNSALDDLIAKLGKEIDTASELDLLEQAVKLCHQIRSLEAK